MLWIGLDGGGTKTEAVLCNQEGEVLSRKTGGPCCATGLPFKTACENLEKITEALFEDEKRLPQDVACAFFGISGCGIPAYRTRFEAFLWERFAAFGRILVGSDALNPLYGELGEKNGIAAICGTGSGAFARADGKIYRVDGHGFLLGDEAGGFRMGQLALRAALREEDGRGPETLLTALCREKAGKNVTDALPELTDGGKAAVAAFAPCFLAARSQTDPEACRLMAEIEAAMAETIAAAGRYLPEKSKPVVLCGSIWKADSLFRQNVFATLGAAYVPILPANSPAFGAAVRARLQESAI